MDTTYQSSTLLLFFERNICVSQHLAWLMEFLFRYRMLILITVSHFSSSVKMVLRYLDICMMSISSISKSHLGLFYFVDDQTFYLLQLMVSQFVSLSFSTLSMRSYSTLSVRSYNLFSKSAINIFLFYVCLTIAPKNFSQLPRVVRFTRSPIFKSLLTVHC